MYFYHVILIFKSGVIKSQFLNIQVMNNCAVVRICCWNTLPFILLIHMMATQKLRQFDNSETWSNLGDYYSKHKKLTDPGTQTFDAQTQGVK